MLESMGVKGVGWGVGWVGRVRRGGWIIGGWRYGVISLSNGLWVIGWGRMEMRLW